MLRRPPRPVGPFVRHRYVAFSLPPPSLSLFLLFRHTHTLSLSFLSALGVPFPVSRARNTPDLLAAQIKIEQPAIKCKWGYWPEPLRPVIDFHGAAPRVLARRALDLYFFSVDREFYGRPYYLALITSASLPDRGGAHSSRGNRENPRWILFRGKSVLFLAHICFFFFSLFRNRMDEGLGLAMTLCTPQISSSRGRKIVISDCQ